jgi:ribonuclease-3
VHSLFERLDYQFQNSNLLTQALTHRSFGKENNERLEFLGDGVLNFIIAHQLYMRFPALPEGDLSRLRAQLVKEVTLSEIAISLELGQTLNLGEGEKKSAGWRRPSILADAVEAIVGAAYLDGGFPAAELLVKQFFDVRLDTINPEAIGKDAKSQLQEFLQSKRQSLPVYTVLETQGEAHAQQFVVSCEVDVYKIKTVGEGSSRRIAEQQAAQLALAEIKG